MAHGNVRIVPNRFASDRVLEHLSDLLSDLEGHPPAGAVVAAEQAAKLIARWQEGLLVLARSLDQSASWAEIAADLDISRQAAWSRWHHLDKDDPSDPARLRLRAAIDRATGTYRTILADGGEPSEAFDAAYELEREGVIDYLQNSFDL